MSKLSAQQKKEISNIIRDVPKKFDIKDKTNRGHTKFVRFDLGISTLCYKPNKPLQIEINGTPKFDFGSLLDTQVMEFFRDNHEALNLLYEGLSGDKSKVKKKSKLELKL